METKEEYQLLFFDTFAQTDGPDGPNLGLVQFPNPIIIKEIRIIPLGARVEADFPGGYRLGATNPSSFGLEFFINDLTKQSSCTFLDIGRLDYKQNVNIKFVPNESIPTDGLIIRGMYSTLTLSVFGSIIPENAVQPSTVITEEVEAVPKLEEETVLQKKIISDVVVDNELTKPIEVLPIIERIVDKTETEIKLTKIVETLVVETKEEVPIKSHSPTVSRKSESHETQSRISPLNNDKSDHKRKDYNDSYRSSRQTRDKSHRSRKSRSPVVSNSVKARSRSRSKTKSKSRSTTPNSLKRYRYNHRPSSPYDKCDRSPKPIHKSPRRHRSRSVSPRSPHHSNKGISRSPLSPHSRSVSRSRNRSLTKSPLLQTRHRIEVKENIEFTKIETKPTVESNDCALNDSDIFEPLSPEDSLSEIAEKISDEENFDQIFEDPPEEPIESHSKDDFEVITSDEEYLEEDNVDSELLMDYSEYELRAYADLGAFNPFQCEFTSLQTLKDPSLSVFDALEFDNSVDSENHLKLPVIELINSIKTQRNDKWVEGVEQISIEIHKNLIKDESVIKTLIDFVVDGIDFNLAMKQSNTAYKVRHLKAGIKLMIALSQTSDKILKQLLDLNLTYSLLQLYERQYMTIPVRLLIIRGIDSICDYPSGVDHLIGHKYIWTSEQNNTLEQTCYQRILDIFMKKPSTRLMVSLTCLLKKIHLLEAIKHVSTVLIKPNESQQQNNNQFNEDSLPICLNEISLTFKNANNLLSQPLRSLPTTKQFDMKTSPFDSYKSIYKYFKYHKIVDCLTNIFLDKIPSNGDTLDSALDLLNSLSNSCHGLRFLLSSETINSTNNLYKVLIQLCGTSDPESQFQNIVLKLIYRLQVLQLVDMVFAFNSNQESFKNDEPELMAALHSLYTMLFTGYGRDAVVHVLSSENNFDSILPFICVNGDQKKETLINNSVSFSCAVELCLVTLQLIDTNLLNFFDSYGQTLIKVFENESIPKLQTLSNWLSPIKYISYKDYTETTFKSLLSVINKHYESIRESAENSLFTITPELITTLRILQNLCSSTELSSPEGDIQLKHRYALIQIFSSDGLSQILFLLNKLCETYLKPSHQNCALTGNQGSLVVNFIKPSVLIIKSILTYLVSSRGSDFKDVAPIPVLLRVYSVVSLIPSSVATHLNASIVQQIQYEISEILLIYTELDIIGAESDEAINKSVWTKMAKYLIEYVLSSPLAFIHGLTLLSDVLPQPLPLLVKQPMLSHEVLKTINFRKLWSLHLHGLNEHIDSLITDLISSNSPAIQLLLKRICVQLCDLSIPSVNIVTKSVMEALLSSLESLNESTIESRNVCPAVRILNFINDLSTNTPFKLAFLTILGNCIKKDDKNENILTRLQSVLNKSLQINSNDSVANFIIHSNPELDVNSSEVTTNGNTSESNKNESVLNEANVVNTESLSDHFANRPIFVLEEERLASDWFSATTDESEHFDFSDANKIDLLDLSIKYFGTDFDIRSNLAKLWTEPINETQNKDNDDLDKNIQLPFIRPFFGPRETNQMNKRIQAPRGRGRAFTRINDPFRSRPPNTSRPPSMHVDDFVALERNDNPKRINKEFIRPNRGMNVPPLRSFGPNQRSTNAGNYRPPTNSRNITDRYNNRDLHRLNKNDNNFPLRWNRITGNNSRYDFRYPQYSRSFPR